MTAKTTELTNTENVKEILLPDNQRNFTIIKVNISKDTHFDISLYVLYNADEAGVDEAGVGQEIDPNPQNLPKRISFSEEKINDDKIYLKSGFISDGKADDLYEATKDLCYKVLVSYTLC